MTSPRAPGALALAGELRRIGVRPGTRLLVHAALRGTGLRAEPLRDALTDVLGPHGTLVVPAFTSENSRTSAAHLERIAGLSEPQVRRFRARMPAFDPRLTPSQGVGRFAETVRTSPGAARSTHPQTSFAALGKDARRLCAGHRLECHLGEESPLGRMCGEGGQVLMINVGFSSCTAFHLAEYRIPEPPLRMYDCVVKVNLPGGRRGEGWTTYEDVALDDSDFAQIGDAFPDSRLRRGRLGGAGAVLFSIPDAVGHALDWMTENRR
ncbi:MULTISPECIES: aminoglycoside N(3)-acetyltransferase [unclassified Streptomyces]|uniref:aminoglycoside N(3)-acetyltransferase n=1 Tax=unclassified Streptomyces TaxID=2593676 RepID=UPI002E32062F|nr:MULTISPECIES: AAC(3) family N-acetyltransferase [unclassified Streptomyces]WUC67116.1 AAC(3) family N-acetyltransferase [Streptomyces sp. NBC_00539]